MRYYNYALYGLVRIGSTIDRRQIREELIAYLLDHHDPGEAATELSALERELPDDAPSQLAAARLALRCRRPAPGAPVFQAAARLDPPNVEAFEGLGEADFAMRDYASAAAHLARRTEPRRGETSDHLDVARLVLARDPLGRAPHGAGARGPRGGRRPLGRAGRYDACTVATGSAADGSDRTRSDLERVRSSRGAASFVDA